MLRWDGLTEKVRSSNAFPEPSGETSALFSTVRPRLRGGGYKHPRCSSCSLERVLAQGAPLWSPKRQSVKRFRYCGTVEENIESISCWGEGQPMGK